MARQLLDTRADAKLSEFAGVREKFENWAFLFESYAHLFGWGEYVEVCPSPCKIGAHCSPLLRARHIVRSPWEAAHERKHRAAPPRRDGRGSSMERSGMGCSS